MISIETEDRLCGRFFVVKNYTTCKQKQIESSIQNDFLNQTQERNIRFIDVDKVLETQNNKSNSYNNIDEACEKTASKLEFILTIVFIFGFIIFSIIMFTSIPNYKNTKEIYSL